MKQALFVLERCFDMFSYIYIYIPTRKMKFNANNEKFHRENGLDK